MHIFYCIKWILGEFKLLIHMDCEIWIVCALVFSRIIHAHYVNNIIDYYINNAIKTFLFLLKRGTKIVQ